jgi:hypothetical protein
MYNLTNMGTVLFHLLDAWHLFKQRFKFRIFRSLPGGSRDPGLHQRAADAVDFDAPPHLRASAEPLLLGSNHACLDGGNQYIYISDHLLYFATQMPATEQPRGLFISGWQSRDDRRLDKQNPKESAPA